MKKRIATAVLVIFSAFLLFNVVQAVGAVPGSDSDPLITLSYLEKKIQEVTGSIQSMNQKVEQMYSSLTALDSKVENISKQTGQDSAGAYELVNVPAGKKMICEASTEIILRSGKAKVVSETSAGLSDVTTGADIGAGMSVAKNHLLMVPRTDGRGIAAESASILMVKGKYQIQ